MPSSEFTTRNKISHDLVAALFGLMVTVMFAKPGAEFLDPEDKSWETFGKIVIGFFAVSFFFANSVFASFSMENAFDRHFDPESQWSNAKKFMRNYFGIPSAILHQYVLRQQGQDSAEDNIHMPNRSAFWLSNVINFIATPTILALLWGDLKTPKKETELKTSENPAIKFIQQKYRKIPNNVKRTAGQISTICLALQLGQFYSNTCLEAPVTFEFGDRAITLGHSASEDTLYFAIQAFDVAAVLNLIASFSDLSANFLGYNPSKDYKKVLGWFKKYLSPFMITMLWFLGTNFCFDLVRDPDDSQLDFWLKLGGAATYTTASISHFSLALFRKDPIQRRGETQNLPSTVTITPLEHLTTEDLHEDPLEATKTSMQYN